jgi:hypothetical protein
LTVAKKKKAVEAIPPCLHCGTEFRTPIGWCSRCEDHMASAQIIDGECTRCRKGENARYLKRRKGSPARVEAELARILAEHGPMVVPGTGPLSVAFEAWCASPEYKLRFVRAEEIAAAAARPSPEEDDAKWIDEFAGL